MPHALHDGLHQQVQPMEWVGGWVKITSRKDKHEE